MPIGDIGTVLDTHIFEATHGLYPAPWTIDGTLCCVCYAGPSDYSWARSFNVDASGHITEPASNTLQLTDFATSRHRGPLRLDNVVCPVFWDGSLAGDLQGVIVNPDGTLTQHANHECPIINSVTEWHQAILRPDGVVAAIHNHSAGYIFVSTATVQENGEVSVAPIDNFQHTTFLTSYPSIAYSTGSILLTTYTNALQHLRAKSVGIDSAGNVSATGQSEVIVTDYITAQHMAIKIDNNKFIVAHGGPAGCSRALALTMTPAGAITVPTNYHHDIDADAGVNPFIIRLSDEVFACVYTAGGPVGKLKTFKAHIDESVTWTDLDSHTFTGVQMLWPQIVDLGNDISVIAFHDHLNRGILTTIELKTAGNLPGHTELTTGIGP